MPAMNETTYPRFWAEHGLIDEVCVIYFSWVQPPMDQPIFAGELLIFMLPYVSLRSMG